MKFRTNLSAHVNVTTAKLSSWQTFHTSDKAVSHIGGQKKKLQVNQPELVFDVGHAHFDVDADPLDREITNSFRAIETIGREVEDHKRRREEAIQTERRERQTQEVAANHAMWRRISDYFDGHAWYMLCRYSEHPCLK